MRNHKKNDKLLSEELSKEKALEKIICDIAPVGWDEASKQLIKPCNITYTPGSLPECTLGKYQKCLEEMYKEFGGFPVKIIEKKLKKGEDNIEQYQ